MDDDDYLEMRLSMVLLCVASTLKIFSIQELMHILKCSSMKSHVMINGIRFGKAVMSLDESL